jgi:hypothetical protein
MCIPLVVLSGQPQKNEAADFAHTWILPAEKKKKDEE